MSKVISFLVSFVVLTWLASPLMAQEEEPEATPVPSEEINENIKERLIKVAGEQTGITSQKRKQAVAGDLQSIANDTLTIRTDGQVSLASVSGQTTYVNIDSGDELDLEDLVIGDYVVALGFINGSEVLDTRRVLLYDEKPEPVGKTSFFGNVDSIDEDDETVTLLSPTGETVTVYISTISITETGIGDEVEEVELSDLSLGQTVALVYLTDEDGDHELLSLLAVPPALETMDGLEATESGVLEEDEQIPAELGN